MAWKVTHRQTSYVTVIGELLFWQACFQWGPAGNCSVNLASSPALTVAHALRVCVCVCISLFLVGLHPTTVAVP